MYTKGNIQLTKGQRDRALMLRMIDNTMRLEYAWKGAYYRLTSANTHANEIYDTLDESKWDEHFILATRKYLREFHDTNLSLLVPENHAKDAALPDFEAHKSGENLTVTKALEGSLLRRGDVITHLGARTVEEYEEIARFYLPRSTEDPYREDWSLALASVKEITVKRGSEEFRIPVPRQAGAEQALRTVSCIKPEHMPEGVVCLSMKDFSAEAAEQAAAQLADEKMKDVKYLILDLRCCRDDDDLVYVPFLPALTRTCSASVYPETAYYTHYTDENILRRINMLQNAAEADPENKEIYDEMILEAESMRGKGYVREEDEPIPARPGKAAAFRTVLLFDHTTEGAAERFARYCVENTDCLTAGRTSCGSCDTFGLVTYPLGDGYGLVYPISVSSYAYEKEDFFAGQGVTPRTWIAWQYSPEQKDTDLQALLKSLGF